MTNNDEQSGIQIERWEGDEYVIVIDGQGVVGPTLHRQDAETVMRWLRRAASELGLG